MRKWLVRVMVLGLILGFGGLGITATDKGPEVIKIPTPKKKIKIKKKGTTVTLETTVTLSHYKHQELLKGNCGECHHGKTADWKKAPYKEGMKIEKCETCHNKSHPNKKLNSPKKAMHKNCKDCHKKRKKDGKKHGPVKCKDCHKKS